MQQYSQLIFVGLMLAAFWFLMIRPQQQRAKSQRMMLDALKPGDSVMTIGGMYATVLEVGERVRVAAADGAEMEFAPSAIARVIANEQGEPDLGDPDIGGKTADEDGASDADA